ncbi:MAG TPA: hypothetical protein VF221_18305, partial [Chloroflexota bacterium]
RTIAHIPQVLYSWRKSDTSTAVASSAKPYAIQAARHTLQDTIGRREMDATLEPSHMNGLFLIRHHPPSPTRVSLVLRGAARGWPAALDSPDIQVCDVTWIVGQHAEDYLERINEGAGDFLVFLDAEERPRSAKSISALLAYAQRDGTGVAAGMTVRRGTGDVLQAGLAIGQDGQPFYMYDGLPPFPLRNFYLNLKDLPREVSVGHAGCSAMRRAVWDALGGWSRDLPLPLTWWDLCLRALEAGYENVYTPLAQFEARAPLPPIPSVAAHDWPWRHFRDPFWNPNLTPAGSFGLPFRCDGDRRARCRPGSAAVLSSLLD